MNQHTYDKASWDALYQELAVLRGHKEEADRHIITIAKLRTERNLLREMFNSAEKELAAEQAENVRLRGELAVTLQHCEACGTLTDTQQCDCTKMETGTQHLVPFSLQNFRSTIEAELAAERAARIAVASPVRQEEEL